MSVIYKHGRRYYCTVAKDQPKDPVYVRKDALCGRFFCNIMDDAICCAGCPKFLQCDFACLNSPDKCGLCVGPGD
jgi:hypothetical protein